MRHDDDERGVPDVLGLKATEGDHSSQEVRTFLYTTHVHPLDIDELQGLTENTTSDEEGS